MEEGDQTPRGMGEEVRMEFSWLELEETVTVEKLYSFHYFEYAKGFVFEGEEHDFWEMLYVDKGEVEVRADDRLYELSQGNLIFHKPGEFHTVQVSLRHKPPNLVVLSFACRSPYMKRFENKVASLGRQEQDWLGLLVQEGFRTFQPPYDRPDRHELHIRPDAPLAGQQAFKSHLEMLLIRLLRNEEASRPADRGAQASPKQENAELRLVEQVVAAMKERLAEPLSLSELCRTVHVGKSRLQELFRARQGVGVMEYYKRLKMEEAKSLIREKRYNFSEIAALLGYSSLHYFSRDFKRTTGMSPSDYARSVMARAETKLQ